MATIFHTATLIDGGIYIIGSLGYVEERRKNTSVYYLNTDDFSIKKIKTQNHIGWIFDHNSQLVNNTIVVTKGSIWDNEKKDLIENEKKFVLDLESLVWSLA